VIAENPPTVQQLEDKGKDQGHITYDDLIDLLPDEWVDPAKVDMLLHRFDIHKIRILDGTARKIERKVKFSEDKKPSRRSVKDFDAADFDEDDPEAKAALAQALADATTRRIDDPVRMYLRKMGSVSLLTREGEVEIAKRIEDGEMRIFEVILQSKVGIAGLVELGDRLRAGEIRVKDVLTQIFSPRVLH